MKKKNFKFFISCLIMVACIFSTSVPAMASDYSTGKAVIPYFYHGPVDSCFFKVSNITDDSIDVTITLYNQDGSIVTDDGSTTAGAITVGTQALDQALDYSDNNTGNTVTFTLNEHCSTLILLNTTGSDSLKYVGYGIISWQQNSNALQGLVVHGTQLYVDATSTKAARFSIPVNCGLPF